MVSKVEPSNKSPLKFSGSLVTLNKSIGYIIFLTYISAAGAFQNPYIRYAPLPQSAHKAPPDYPYLRQ
jgi:hypothetical protein